MIAPDRPKKDTSEPSTGRVRMNDVSPPDGLLHNNPPGLSPGHGLLHNNSGSGDRMGDLTGRGAHSNLEDVTKNAFYSNSTVSEKMLTKMLMNLRLVNSIWY